MKVSQNPTVTIPIPGLQIAALILSALSIGGTGGQWLTGWFVQTHHPFKETSFESTWLIMDYLSNLQKQVCNYKYFIIPCLTFILLGYFCLVLVWFHWSNVKILADRNPIKGNMFFLSG